MHFFFQRSSPVILFARQSGQSAEKAGMQVFVIETLKIIRHSIVLGDSVGRERESEKCLDLPYT